MHFVHNLTGHMKMTSLLWRHVYIIQSQSVQYFAHKYHFTTTASYQKNEHVQQWNQLKCQASMFHFLTYRQNSFKQLSQL